VARLVSSECLHWTGGRWQHLTNVNINLIQNDNVDADWWCHARRWHTMIAAQVKLSPVRVATVKQLIMVSFSYQNLHDNLIVNLLRHKLHYNYSLLRFIKAQKVQFTG